MWPITLGVSRKGPVIERPDGFYWAQWGQFSAEFALWLASERLSASLGLSLVN